MIRTDARVDDWVQRAKSVSIEDAASFVGARLKRNGTDFCGVCPAGCASKDGFVVTPKSGLFVCRPSGEGGGPVDLVMHARGCDFLSACEVLTGEPRPQGAREESEFDRQARETKTRERQEAAEQRRSQQEAVELSDHEREQAVVRRMLLLMQPITGTPVDAYLRARGLTPGPWCDGFGFVPNAPYYADGEIVARVPLMLAPIVHYSAAIPEGRICGLHRTYLDPEKPAKYRPSDGGAKKFYGDAYGGLIPLGPIGETLMIGEGIETTRAAYQLGIGGDDVTTAAAGSLVNLSGSCTGTVPHPTLLNPKTGKPVLIANGIPDMDRPGMILPPQVKRLILLGDGDSERLMTRARVLAAARRHRADGIEVSVQFSADGHDFASMAVAA